MKKILIGLLCILSPLTDLKLGSIQPVELLMFFLFPIAIYRIFADLEIKSSAETISLLRKYVFFLVAVAAISLLSLRLRVFLPSDMSLLKTPPFLSMAKLFQLVMIVLVMFILIFWFVKQPKLMDYFSRGYIYVGLFNSVFALASCLAMFAGLDLGGAYGEDWPRAKGFFVEGGPFGTYLVSVLLIVMFRKKVLNKGTQLQAYVHMLLLILALFASSSKAAFLLVFVLMIYFQVINKKAKYILFVVALMVPLLFATGKIQGLVGYFSNYNNFTEKAAGNPDDPNLVMGRLMASVLVPRILLDHPLTGVGLGNYSLQRNNPDYLQGLPATDKWDLPGLGLAGYAAELGLPLIFFFIWLVWHPVKIMQKKNLSPFLIVLASYQLFGFLLGTQITFIYPWLVAAVALGYCFGLNNADYEEKDSMIVNLNHTDNKY